MRSGKLLSRWALATAMAVALLVMLLAEPAWERSLRYLFPGQRTVLYERSSLAGLAGEHLFLVGLASLLSTLLGVAGGIVVTRKGGRDFIPVIDEIGRAPV